MDDSQTLIINALGDKYEIKDLLQSGGMGKIYLGVHKALGRKVAIKIIHQELVKNEEFKKRFYREAKLAAGLDHPGIIDIYDFGSNDEFDYIIMPYIEGETFQQRIKREGPFKISEAVDLMIKITDALHYAHQHNVYHRDIKPSNIMLDHQGRVIIADFGISKEIGDSDLTAPNTVLGSPRYMSPEQIKGESVDARSDLYSLGLVFYEMVAGRHPFHGKDTTAIYYAQAHEIPARPETIAGGTPGPLANIIMRLLEKTPEKRYADGGALLKDLLDYQSGKLNDTKVDDATLVDAPKTVDDDATLVGDGTVAERIAAGPSPTAPAEASSVRAFLEANKKKLAVGFGLLLVLFLVVILLPGKSDKESADLSGGRQAAKPTAAPGAPPAAGPASPETVGPADIRPGPESVPTTVQEPAVPDRPIDRLLALGNGKAADMFDIRTDARSYRIGQTMRFAFETQKPCYALILTYTTGDELIQVFPNYYQPSQFVQPGRTYEIPNENMGFDLKVTGPAGTETLVALISDKPLDLLGSSFTESNPFLLLNAKDSFKISAVLKKIESLRGEDIYSKSLTYAIN
jgi:tRNA A-37 threonylcarbamoyl transferase component Bud32